MFIAVLDDLAREITDELNAQQTGCGPMEALRSAHMAVLGRVAQRPLAGLTAERIMLILRVIYSSDVLRQAAIEYRSPPAMAALARQLGVDADDRRLDLAVALFSTTIVSACHDVIAGDPAATYGPGYVMERLEQALSDVAQFTPNSTCRSAELPAYPRAVDGDRDADHGNDGTDDRPRRGVGHRASPRTPKPCNAQSTPKHATTTPIPVTTMRMPRG